MTQAMPFFAKQGYLAASPNRPALITAFLMLWDLMGLIKI
jgi:hypothetical protein